MKFSSLVVIVSKALNMVCLSYWSFRMSTEVVPKKGFTGKMWILRSNEVRLEEKTS